MPEWPGEARGALCLSFDNLGEAAELELGAQPEAPGEHPSVTRALPALLDALCERDIAATFFVEGINAELYPEALQTIATAGHEVAYHAWRHEQWGELSAGDQAENLARGIVAFAERGLEIAGMRPPGGQLGTGGIEVMRKAGLRYCSPAGEGAGAEDGVALLPFQWPHVDASCVLPPLAPVREQITGSSTPVGPEAFLGHLEAKIDHLAQEGSYANIVLHLFMLDWFGLNRLTRLLERVRQAASSNDIWVARCDSAADYVLSRQAVFAGGASLTQPAGSANYDGQMNRLPVTPSSACRRA